MKFVAISDTHGCHRQLNLPHGDVLLHAGDICDQGNQKHVEDFFNWITDLKFKYIVFVRGNHDINLIDKSSLLDVNFPNHVFQLDHSGTVIGNIPIWGVPFPLDWEKRKWDTIPTNTKILITHQPPYSILDLPPNSKSRGEKKLLEKVKQTQPMVHLFGHIHASYGQIKINDTLFINASNYKASEKRIVNPPITFEL